eukprot:scaffold376417_cov28-Prasinocladus_malaysianus.AAC.2
MRTQSTTYAIQQPVTILTKANGYDTIRVCSFLCITLVKYRDIRVSRLGSLYTEIPFREPFEQPSLSQEAQSHRAYSHACCRIWR